MEDRKKLADKFMDLPESVWRQYLPPPFSPIDLRSTPLQLLSDHGPSTDVSILGFTRGSALEEFIALSPKAFAKANKNLRKTRKTGTVRAANATT